jgi:hypothetical protein
MKESRQVRIAMEKLDWAIRGGTVVSAEGTKICDVGIHAGKITGSATISVKLWRRSTR